MGSIFQPGALLLWKPLTGKIWDKEALLLFQSLRRQTEKYRAEV
jgi:hypothetical protein